MGILEEILRSVTPIARAGSSIATLIGAFQSERERRSASKRLQELISSGVAQGQRLDEETAPLRKAATASLMEILTGTAPEGFTGVSNRILNPRVGSLARGFNAARENIISRIPQGGNQNKLLAESFENEAVGRSDLESKLLQNALQTATSVGFRTPSTSIQSAFTGASGQAGIASEAARRQALAGRAFGALLAQKA